MADYAQAIAMTSAGGYRLFMIVKKRKRPSGYNAQVADAGRRDRIRHFAVILWLLMFVLTPSATSAGQGVEHVRGRVDYFVIAVDKIAHMQGETTERQRALLHLLSEALDIPAIATFLAGPAGKEAAAPEKRLRQVDDFAAILPSFLVGDLHLDPALMRGFRHGIDRVVAVAGGYDVYAHAVLPATIGMKMGGRPLELVWHLRRDGGVLRIADLRIEGISLLQMLRPFLGLRVGLGQEDLAEVTMRMRRAAGCRPAVMNCGG